MEPKAKRTSDSTHEAASNERLIQIFDREIEREVAEKMVALTEISKNIKKCQQNLERLRKEAVTKFYMDSKQKEENVEQHSIHPAVKKLIGKRPIVTTATEEFMRNNMTEWCRETRRKRRLSHTLHKNKRKAKTTDTCVNDSGSENPIKPCYVPPVIPGNPQENSTSRGNTKKTHIRVLVGNIAKQVESEGQGSATHKWMVYVRSALGSLCLEEQIIKVCFYLHPSYKPNDVITIMKPPFTVNRRGWGEFPLRVQLFFKNPLNKTADIIHNLKLNGARSGFHTRSAETFADLWIYPYQDIRFPPARESHSQEILLLASNMLKEEVPDFTSEVMCHKCLITSTSSEVYKCTCVLAQQPEDTCDTVIDETSVMDTDSDSDSDSSEYNDSESDLKFLGSIDALTPARSLYTETLTDQTLSSTVTTESTKKEDKQGKLKTEFDSNSRNLPVKMFACQKLITSTTTSNSNENQEIKPDPDSNMSLQNSKKLTKTILENQIHTTPHNISESTTFQDFKKEVKTEFDHGSFQSQAETLSKLNFTSERCEDQEIKKEFNSCLPLSDKTAASYLGFNEQMQSQYGEIESYFDNNPSGKTEAINTNGFIEDIYLTNQFLENQSDLLDLNVEPSDLFDELGIKEEILEEMQKDFNKELGEEKLLLDFVSENLMEWCSEDSSINLNKKVSIEHQQMKNEMREYLETKPTTNQESSVNKFIVDDSKSETNTFLACQTIAQESQVIEEIPINMFIDNIVEEEVIIDNSEPISNVNPDEASSLVEENYTCSSVVADKCDGLISSSPPPKVDIQSNTSSFNPPSSINPSNDIQNLNFNIVEEEVIVDETLNTQKSDTCKFVDQRNIVNSTSSVVAAVSNNLPSKKLDVQNSTSATFKSSTTTPSKAVEKSTIVCRTTNTKINGTGKLIKQKDNVSSVRSMCSLPAGKSTTFKSSSSTNSLKNVQTLNLQACTKEPKSINKHQIEINTFNENKKIELITYEDGVKSLVSVQTKPSSVGQLLRKKDLNSCVLTTSNYNSKSILVNTKSSQSLLKPNVKNPNSLLKSNHARLSNSNGVPGQIPSISKTLVQEPKVTQNIIVKKVITSNQQSNNGRNVILSGLGSSVNQKSVYLQHANVKPAVQIMQNKNNKNVPVVLKQCIVGVKTPRLQNPITRLSQTPCQMNKLGLHSANVNVTSTVKGFGGQITKHTPQRNAITIPFQKATVKFATTKVQNCNVVTEPSTSQVSNQRPLVMKATLSPLTTIRYQNQQKTIVQNGKPPHVQNSVSAQNIKTQNPCEQNHPQTLLPNGFVNGHSNVVIPQPRACNPGDFQNHPTCSSALKKNILKPLNKKSSRKQESTFILRDPPNFIEPDLNYEEILSINELRKVLRLPEINIPLNNEDFKTNYNYVLTCNSLHNDLKHAVPLYNYKNKCMMLKKDYLSSLANEQLDFYLHQLSLLVNSCKFTETEHAVRWLIRGMPLVHPDARLSSFKSLHPYCAISADMYCSWPRAKQVASKWLRSKTVEKLLKALKGKGVGLKNIWTTGTIYSWSQTHGYCPAFQPSGTDSETSKNENIVQSLCKETHPDNVMQWMDSVVRKPQPPEELIDVVGEGSKVSVGVERMRLSPTPEDCDEGVICGKPWVKDMDVYVRKQVRGRLALEQLIPEGTSQPLAATVLSHLAVNFMEDLTRRATAVCNSRDGATVLPRDVAQALLQRPEFDILRKEGLQIDSKVNEFLNKYKSSHR